MTDNNSAQSIFNEPHKKRRKLSRSEVDEKKADDDLLLDEEPEICDIIDDSTSNSGYQFDTMKKLSYLGPSSGTSSVCSIGSLGSLGDGHSINTVFKNKEVYDFISIKNEMNGYTNTRDGQRVILSLYHKNMKSYARGGDHIYEKTMNKKGKEVMKKKEGVFAHIKWAVPVGAGGGASTRYHAIERLAVAGSCAVAVHNWRELKMAPDLGFVQVGNIGKAYRLYIILIYKTKLGFRFPEFIRYRNEQSFIKHVKSNLTKKNPDPDSIRLRTIVSTAPFDNVPNVAKTNRQSISLSYSAVSAAPSNTRPASLPPPTGPWCPKVAKSPSTSQILAKADGLLDDLKKNMVTMQSEMNGISGIQDPLDWTNLDDDAPTDKPTTTPPIFATPPNPKQSPSNVTMYEDQDTIFFEQVGRIMDISTKSKEEEHVKDEVTNGLISKWSQDQYKPHILGICKFIKEHKLSGMHKLKLLALDLSMLE